MAIQHRQGRLWAAGAAVVLAAAAAKAMAGRERAAYTEPLRRQSIVESAYGIGTVTAARTYQLKVGVVSHIQKLLAREGDTVARGAPLIVLDEVVYRAPFAGTVTSLPYKPGENVFAGLPILELVDLSDRYLVVSLEQRAVLRVRPGQSARLSFENMRERSYEGRVESVYSHEGTFLVRIGAPELPPQVLPGMTADVAVAVGQPRDALVIPVAALEGGKVRVKRGPGRAALVPVRTGVVDGPWAEVLSGEVREGDLLLVRGKKK